MAKKRRKRLKDYTPHEMHEKCNIGGIKLKHFEVLSKNLKHLNQNENVSMIFSGSFSGTGDFGGTGDCAFAVTRRNLLINRKKMFGEYSCAVSANEIINIDLKKGWFSSDIVIHTSQKKLIINFVDKKHAENVAHELINIYISKDVTIYDIDLMKGTEFEFFLAQLFEKMGYEIEVTQKSGDQGIDLIAFKFGEKLGIQAKRYSGNVGNRAIQEVVAGLPLYKCKKGMVVSSSYFTKPAIELAKANKITLWDRDVLIKKLENPFI